MKKKLRVGWFSFSCCEDSTIIFTELLNDYWMQWRNKIEFAYAPILQKRGKPTNIDIFFVEGAITSSKQEEMLKKFRANSKKMVAIGACACTGMPSAARNAFDEATKNEIQNLLIRFQYADRVKRIKDIVAIDAEVNGCPMVEQIFLQVLNQLIAEFDSKAGM